MNLIDVAISIASSGDNTIITGVSGQQIKVRRLVLINNVATAQAVTIKDGASTNLSGQFGLPSSIGGGIILADTPNDPPLFICSSGNNFVVNLSAATAVAGFAQYTLG